MTPRTLRSKQARNGLWLAADGACQRCGRPLGDDWQADHRIPWSLTQRTDARDMQALCAVCNREKATMPIREHQRDFEWLMKRIATGEAPLPALIGAHVACGGGKSALPVIGAHYLISRARVLQRICWVTPNCALRDQALDAFADPRWRQYLGHELDVYASANTPNPSKGSAGYVTTYQALLADAKGVNLDEFTRHGPYGLWLDEPHHLREDGALREAVAPLVEKARCVVLMTGTVDRADHKPVYLFRYHDRLVDTRSTDDFPWIRYGLRMAKHERAIINTYFRRIDGAARWMEGSETREVESLAEDQSAVFAALNSQYALQLLETCVRDWQGYRQDHARSKLLVVCANIAQAKRMLAHLRALGIERADIATSADTDPRDAIKKFKGKYGPGTELDVLVTVAMAYEGLDVPSITHLACLTHIRSRPWIEQMFARAWRHDPAGGPWESQSARIFCPDDALMRAVIEAIEAELQAPIGGEGPPPPPPSPRPTITGEWSELTDQRARELHGDEMTVAETARYLEIAATVGLPLAPHQVRALLAAAEKVPLGVASPRANGHAPGENAQDRLDRKKKHLEKMIGETAGRMCYGDRELLIQVKVDIQTELKARFGERPSLDEAAIEAAIRWVEERYGP